MKKWLSYIFYFIGVLAITYPFQWILVLLIGSIQFTAADAPPGDISLGAKILFSVGVPLFYSICLTIAFFLYRALLKQFNIELKGLIPILFNILIALLLIVDFTIAVFDLSLSF